MIDNKYQYMVATRCITYNQARFITDALNGFVIQKTSFPVVYTIIDDASTDGTQDVLRKWSDINLHGFSDHELWIEKDYGHIAIGSYKDNNDVVFVIILLFENHNQTGRKLLKLSYIAEWLDASKYIAFCEGDDYWIDPEKLQKQVQFLNSHPDFSMCFHGAKIVVSSGCFDEQRLHQFSGLETREYSGEEIVKQWIIPSASMVYRSNIKLPFDSRFVVGDIVLRNQCSIEGRVFCFADQMSVYRLNEGGRTSRPFPFERAFPHMEALIEHFPQYQDIYEHKYASMIKHALKSRQCLKVFVYLIKHPYLIKYIF